MTIFLEGVAARFYRGIGPETQYIAPFSRLNFFIGANNSGKSIILNLLATQFQKPPKGKTAILLKAVEEYRGKATGPVQLTVGRRVNGTITALKDNDLNLNEKGTYILV